MVAAGQAGAQVALSPPPSHTLPGGRGVAGQAATGWRLGGAGGLNGAAGGVNRKQCLLEPTGAAGREGRCVRWRRVGAGAAR